MSTDLRVNTICEVFCRKTVSTNSAYNPSDSFEQEFLALLKKHGVKFDPKYVWG